MVRLGDLPEFAPEAPAGEKARAAVGTSALIDEARRVLEMEARAILAIASRLTDQFDRAIALLLKCTGKVVVTGMGKSGHIGNKIAATLASTGTPAFFVHPAELRHGDFGALDERDLVIALSGTGETQEIKLALDPIKRLGLPVIAITGNLESTLAAHSDVVLDVAVDREACPLNLAPTTSTTASLAMGDALAVVLMRLKEFQAEDFARSHPGGSLGKSLITVKDVMRVGLDVPKVTASATYQTVLGEVDSKRLGIACVVDAEGRLAGVITDGDLRRAQVRFGPQAFLKAAHEIMSANPKTIPASALAAEALKLMEKHSIADLLIVDGDRRPVGLIDLKDLLRAGII